MSNIVLSVPGMKCGGCVSNVENALKNLAGVNQVEVALASKTAKIDADVPVSDLIAAVHVAGYDAVQIE